MNNMRRFVTRLATFILVFTLSWTSEAQQLDHVLGEIIVEVRDDNGLNNLLKDLREDSAFRSSSSTFLEARNIMKEPMNLWVLKVDHNAVNELHFMEKALKNKHVLLAQQNHITRLRAVPNDPAFSQQWQFINDGQGGGVVDADVDMDLAWDFTTGGLTASGDTIVICVIDDGINLDHPDFGANIWYNHHEIAGNNIDDDGNGYVDDFRGWNAYDDNDNVTIEADHGTPVAGVVGAKGNNAIGVAGVNWDVKIMNVRGEGPEALALASYAYPYTMRKMYNETNGEKGAFVVCTNASWGVNMGMAADAPIWCDFYNMLGEIGILNFGATANSNVDVDEVGDLPTTCESNYLVSVTNVNRFDEKVGAAGFGMRHIDLGAFGQQIYTVNFSSYGAFGGTSAASPMTAGTAALLYSVDCPDFANLSKSNPSQAALVIKDCILHGVDPNSTLQNITTTGGRLNAHNAVQHLLATCGDCTDALGSDVGQLTFTSGALTWYDNQNVGNTSIRYKPLNETEWTEIADVVSGYQIENLTPCTSYEYQTKTDCQNTPNNEYTYSRVFKTDGCCEVPSGIAVTLEGEIATVTWNEVAASSNFVVEWKRVDDSDWTSVNLGVDNSFVIEGVQDCEFYEVRIKSECDITNNESAFSEIIVINGDCEGCTREFCSFSSKNTVDEWIESVEIEDVFINTSGPDPDGYGNYLGLFEAQLNAQQTYNINLTPGHESIIYDEYFSVFIDYNQNGVFEDEETVFDQFSPTQTTISGSFTVPVNAIAGVTRMRVVMRFNEPNGPCDDVGFEFGEVEDYCVEIFNDSDCSNTFGVDVIDSTLTSLTFEVLENNMAQFYLIAIRKKGTEEFSIITSQLNDILVSNLEICTLYEFSSGYICNGETFIDPEIQEMYTLCEVANTDFLELALDIYPNPSPGILKIDFTPPLEEDIDIDLIANDGRIVFSRIMAKNGEESISIDGSDLPAGIYILRAASEDKVALKKWIKY